MQLGRRAFLAGATSTGLAALAGGPRPSAAMGRTPIGGVVEMALPLSIDGLDPHDPHDPIAALFAPAVFDALFATTEAGVLHPALAAAVPTRDGSGVIVRLRKGLRTAAGTALSGRDVTHALDRARSRGAAALLEPLGEARVAPDDPFAVAFRRADPALVGRILSSPLTAVVPRGFDPRTPDGTGAFAASLSAGSLQLTRNTSAARGAAWLDRITVRGAPDLRAALRSFETGATNLGWLGSGLFGRRADAVAFDLGAAGLVALVVGQDLGAHARPGGAQALCDGIPRDRIAHLGLGELPGGEPAARWLGEPVDLCVESSAPHLVEIARAVAASLGGAGHEITVRPVARKVVLSRSRREALGLVVVRPLAAGVDGARLALTQLEDPARARQSRLDAGAPRAGSARAVTGSLRVGVLGELRVSGGVVRDLRLARDPAGGWDLGASHRRR